MCKGPNFREKSRINYDKCKESIRTALNVCINDMSKKQKIDSIEFEDWKIKILELVEDKIKKLKKTKIPPSSQ